MMETSPYADRTPSEQRWHALSVLNPSRTIKYEYLDYAVSLAVKHE
jgi:hypothetical protein